MLKENYFNQSGCSSKEQVESPLNKKSKIQEQIVTASIDFTKALLTNANVFEALSHGLEIHGNAIQANQVYYWENHYDRNREA